MGPMDHGPCKGMYGQSIRSYGLPWDSRPSGLFYLHVISFQVLCFRILFLLGLLREISNIDLFPRLGL